MLPRSWCTLLVATALLAPAGPAPAAEPGPGEDAFHPEGVLGYAPLGLRDAQVVRKGELALEYRFAREVFDGNRDDTDSVGDDAVRRLGFPDVAYRLTRNEHRLTVLYAPLDRLTLSFTLPYLLTSMKQRAPDGSSFTTRARGLGDVELAAVVPFMKHGTQSVLLDLGMSFPTGDIDVEDERRGRPFRVDYPQRLGSGSFDLVPSLTYRGLAGPLGWGLQVGGTYRLNRNERDYKLGNVFEVSTWAKVEIVRSLTASLRLGYSGWGRISGVDEGLPVLAQTADPNRQAGDRLDIAPGLDVALRFWGEQRLAVEAELPIFQDLDGPQLEKDYRLIAGWQWTF